MKKKLTQKQVDMLWGETGPYSQANLRKEVRILDDAVSRVFLVVEADVNPTTFEIVKKNRNAEEFREDVAIQQLLDHSDHRGPYFGYVSMAFEEEYIDEQALYHAETVLRFTQKTLIKMHKYVMDNYELSLVQSSSELVVKAHGVKKKNARK